GSAWKQQGPVILQDMPCAELQAANERTGMQLESLVAIPILDGHKLINVVVLGIGPGYGGLEIWSRDDRDELSLSGSFYRGLDSFEYMSQFVRFPRGSGLPGACWKECRPKMVNNPDTNPNFIRSFAKDPAFLDTCLGIPVSRDFGSSAYVLLALSSSQCPLAKQIDVVSCESGKPTEDEPHPTVAPIEVFSTQGSLMNDGWIATVCDQLAVSRKAILSRSGIQRDDRENASLVIPFFERNRLTSYVALKLT
ncbi:MAG: GAF domain-containing protein, partial [Planctomycetota bacterium]